MFIYRFFLPPLVTIPLCYQLFGSGPCINDAQIRFLFVGEQFQYDAAFGGILVFAALWRERLFSTAACAMIYLFPRRVSGIGRGATPIAVVEERTARASDSDLANILYTSGTTGEPKG